MGQKDKKLEEMLIKQMAVSQPVSDKVVKTLKHPRYTSGKLIKYGDIILHVLESKADDPTKVYVRLLPETSIPGYDYHPTALLYPKEKVDLEITGAGPALDLPKYATNPYTKIYSYPAGSRKNRSVSSWVDNMLSIMPNEKRR